MTDTPPKNALAIVSSVYQVGIEDALANTPASLEQQRFYIGYAGWSAGQLDREMARGSWHVIPALDEHVFSDDAQRLWERLVPPREHRVSR